MTGRDITIAGPDGPFSAYAAGAGPAVVVIQEIFGVNAVMRGICDDLAAQGFLAVCPDLFWRIEPGIQLTDQTEDDWKRAFELFGAFDPDKGVDDIAATLTTARDAGNGKAGVVGYCLGGFLAYLSACRTASEASVGYYGVKIHEHLGEADNIRHPLMLHVAGQDEFVPPDAQKQIIEGLKDHPKVTIHTYLERDHAFARKGGAHYHAKHAQTADTRTIDFLRRHLG